jgi:hypothetical protein
LKAASGGQAESGHFAHYGREPAMPQALFHGREDLAILPGLDKDDPIGVEADASETGREQIAAAKAPKDGTIKPSNASGHKHRRDSRVFGGKARPARLVQGAEGEASSRKVRIESRHAEGEHSGGALAEVHPRDLLSKLTQNEIAPGIQHALPAQIRC